MRAELSSDNLKASPGFSKVAGQIFYLMAVNYGANRSERTLVDCPRGVHGAAVVDVRI